MTTTFRRAVRCHVQWVLTSLCLQVAGGAWGAEATDAAYEHSVSEGRRVASANLEQDLYVQAYDGEPEFQLASCQTCGQMPSACACGNPADAAGTPCPRTGLFWCSPYGDLVLDPCDREACAPCAQSNPVLFYASAELMPLFRDQNDDVVYQTLGAGGPSVLETGDFTTEFDAGLKMVVGAALTDLYRLEGVYLGSHEWDDRITIRNADANANGGAGNLFSPFSNFGNPLANPTVDFNNLAQIEMTSKFDSVELNLRRRVLVPRSSFPDYNRLCIANSFLVGARHMNLDEQFGYLSGSTSVAGGSVNRASAITTNRMTGVQIGMLSQFLTRRHGWIDFELKGGVFHNEMTLDASYINSTGAGAVVTQFTGADTRDRTSFLGELSLVYNYQFTSHLTFRLGYNAFWLTGVALASQNVPTDLGLLALGPPQLSHEGDLVLHGPNIGLVFAW